MSIAISTINYNSRDLLVSLLRSILAQKISASTIWVVDNCSLDNFRDIVKKEFPKINFIQSTENGGFAKGHNLVLKKLKTDYVLIINPDTKIPDRSIEQMVDFMDQYPDCAAASCKIEGYDGTLHSNGGNFPFGLGLFVWLFNLEMLPFIGKRLANFHRIDQGFYEQGGVVDWVGGTFLVANVEALKKIGLLNEQYFMYFEDTDLCYRLKKSGYKVMINPSVVIKHLSGGSSDDPRFNQFKGEMLGLKIFYKNYATALENILLVPVIYLAIFARILIFTILGKIELSKTYIKVLNYV